MVNEGQEDEQTYSTRVWVYAEDTESIRAYGRIETTVSKSDIKITVDNEETEEDETLTYDNVEVTVDKVSKKRIISLILKVPESNNDDSEAAQ